MTPTIYDMEILQCYLFRSAYQHFLRDNSAALKDQLLLEGKDASLGALPSAASAKVGGSVLLVLKLFLTSM